MFIINLLEEKHRMAMEKNLLVRGFGSLFTYQFSHAWVDFRGIVDEKGVNWFENSVHATIANQYAIDMSNL